MAKSKIARLLLRLGRLLVLLYIVLLACLFFGQRSLIYHPAKFPYDNLAKAAADQGYKPWQGDSGYIGWKHINGTKGDHARLLIFHGNAGCAIDRLGYADALQKVEPLDVYVLEYPGYGARPGKPSEKSFFAAASEAIEQLRKDGPVYVMGESLGNGVAAFVAGKFPEMVRGMVMIAPYSNLTDVARHQMPAFPVGWLLKDRFTSDMYLKNYHGPIAMLFAGQDVIVPNVLGHKLYDGYAGPKIFWQVPDAGHNDLMDEPDSRWEELVKFWKANSIK